MTESRKTLSNIEDWAQDGLGDPQGIVDSFVNMFSSMLQSSGLGVYPKELHRWLDVYYTLRAAAEGHARNMKTYEALTRSINGAGFAVGDPEKDKEQFRKFAKKTLDEATEAFNKTFGCYKENEYGK